MLELEKLRIKKYAKILVYGLALYGAVTLFKGCDQYEKPGVLTQNTSYSNTITQNTITQNTITQNTITQYSPLEKEIKQIDQDDRKKVQPLK